ncbi:hypothetical protein BC739_001630 [Kutzneria viridogrisea]|uniref:Uncharacterized protein n=1 Tax=Kutzneria viridogrisea TaxID=47990 RepID=A0ABR6BC34_9PSEU|nr:hypothetical protein [Kutzneria viridogrisea]
MDQGVLILDHRLPGDVTAVEGAALGLGTGT